MPYEKDPGAIWLKHSDKGDWLSISLNIEILGDLIEGTQGESLRLVAFANKKKKSDNSPDYWIQMPREKKGEETPF